LPPERLRFAAEFLAFLESWSEPRTEKELLRMARFDSDLAAAEADVAAGRLTPVSKLRRKY